MKKNYRTAFNRLKKIGVPVFIHPDAEDRFDISGEEPESTNWVNYWDSPSGWEFGVHPKICSMLGALGLYCECVNPGHLRIYD